MSSRHLKWNTIKIELPEKMISETPSGRVGLRNPLTKSNNIAKSNKKPSVQVIIADVTKPTIIDEGISEEYHPKTRKTKTIQPTVIKVKYDKPEQPTPEEKQASEPEPIPEPIREPAKPVSEFPVKINKPLLLDVIDAQNKFKRHPKFILTPVEDIFKQLRSERYDMNRLKDEYNHRTMSRDPARLFVI